MFLELLQGIGIFYFFTWLIWPFIFVISFIYAINDIVKANNPIIKIIISSISLLIILCGIMAAIIGQS